MGSRTNQGGRLPEETHSGAGHEVPAEAPGGPPSASRPDGGGVAGHVRLKLTELRRLITPAQPAD